MSHACQRDPCAQCKHWCYSMSTFWMPTTIPACMCFFCKMSNPGENSQISDYLSQMRSDGKLSCGSGLSSHFWNAHRAQWANCLLSLISESFIPQKLEMLGWLPVLEDYAPAWPYQQCCAVPLSWNVTIYILQYQPSPARASLFNDLFHLQACLCVLAVWIESPQIICDGLVLRPYLWLSNKSVGWLVPEIPKENRAICQYH